jgi:hypothetical protein
MTVWAAEMSPVVKKLRTASQSPSSASLCKTLVGVVVELGDSMKNEEMGQASSTWTDFLGASSVANQLW